MAVPVTYLAASEQRNAATLPKFSGVPAVPEARRGAGHRGPLAGKAEIHLSASGC
jgi:hypothetical protein